MDKDQFQLAELLLRALNLKRRMMLSYYVCMDM